MPSGCVAADFCVTMCSAPLFSCLTAFCVSKYIAEAQSMHGTFAESNSGVIPSYASLKIRALPMAPALYP